MHLSADDIFGRAQRALPELSRATVYNTVNELVRMGELLEISPGEGPRRYDPNTTSLHHYLYCVDCGALRDVHPEGIDRLSLSKEQQHGFELLDTDIMFRGRCPDCRRRTPAEGAPGEITRPSRGSRP